MVRPRKASFSVVNGLSSFQYAGAWPRVSQDVVDDAIGRLTGLLDC